MSFVESLPTVNACLNAAATVLLLGGFLSIKTGHEIRHRACMISALAVSAVFLFFYVLHKILVKGVHTPFLGEGSIRAVYYVMLFSHIVLAIVILPLIFITINHAIRDRRKLHKKWARWTFPVWLYVSVTGVLIYLFLYVWWQPV